MPNVLYSTEYCNLQCKYTFSLTGCFFVFPLICRNNELLEFIYINIVNSIPYYNWYFYWFITFFKDSSIEMIGGAFIISHSQPWQGYICSSYHDDIQLVYHLVPPADLLSMFFRNTRSQSLFSVWHFWVLETSWLETLEGCCWSGPGALQNLPPRRDPEVRGGGLKLRPLLMHH